MSLSNLASQLAGLNAASSGGSILTSSTRHDDAVGRGIHHSVQIGHAVSVGDPRYKPSLIHEDAKAASDIPLTTLWENCRLALVELSEEYYPPLAAYLTVCQDKLFQPSSHKAKTSLTNLLTILCTLIPHSSTNCLHVLEYLIRRYNIHTMAADTLLLVVLPHCDAYPLLFHRVLQLVNLVGAINQQQVWIWLRPYAATSRHTTTTEGDNVKFPPRHVVVKHAIPNTALLQQICSLTQNVAKLVTAEGKPHRGLQQILSWSVTLVVQGLNYLQTQDMNDSSKESVLRVLLPVCLQACSSPVSSLKDWNMWGQVVATALAETMDLIPQVKQCLSSAILEGLGKTSAANTTTMTADVADALVSISSICCSSSSPATSWRDATKNNWKECVMIPWPQVLQKIWDLRLFPVLQEDGAVTNDILSMAQQEIYEEREIDCTPLLTSLLVWLVLRPPTQYKLLLPEIQKVLMNETLLLEIWKDNSSETFNIETFSEWLVWNFVQQDDYDTNKLTLYQGLLSSLHQMDSQACEKGMATEAMVEMGMDNTDPETKQKTRKQMARLLGGILPKHNRPLFKGEQQSPKKNKTWLPPRVALEHADHVVRIAAIKQLYREFVQQKRNFNSNNNTTTNSDHSDNDSANDDEDDDDVFMTEAASTTDNDKDNFDSLMEGLCRRISSDDNMEVVWTAANVLFKILKAATTHNNSNINNNNAAAIVVPDILSALYQWTEKSQLKHKELLKKEKKEMKKQMKKNKKGKTKNDSTIIIPPKKQRSCWEDGILLHYLLILGVVFKKCKYNIKDKQQDDDEEMEEVESTTTAPSSYYYYQVLIASTAHLDHHNFDVVRASVSSLLKILGYEEEGGQKFLRISLSSTTTTTATTTTTSPTTVGTTTTTAAAAAADDSDNDAKNTTEMTAKILQAKGRAKELLILKEGATFCSKLFPNNNNDNDDEMPEQKHQHIVDNKKTETELCQRSLWIMLAAMKDWLLSKKKQQESENDDINDDEDSNVSVVSQLVIDSCLGVMSSSSFYETKYWKKEKNPERFELLQEAWGIATKTVTPDVVPKTLMSLSSLRKSKVYQSLGKAFIKTLVSSNASTTKKDNNTKNDGERNNFPVSVYTVLLEAALQDNLSVTGVTRLLSLVQNILTRDEGSSEKEDNTEGSSSGNDTTTKESSSWYCVVPALALLEHPDESVRVASLQLLLAWKETTVSKQEAPFSSLTSVCQELSKKQSSATLGGLSFLPSCLAASVQGPDGDSLRNDLLSLCLSAATGLSAASQQQQQVSSSAAKSQGSWLPFGKNIGHIEAAVTVLRAMEHAGEVAFPLTKRWGSFGGPILKTLLDRSSSEGAKMTPLPTGLSLLCDATVGMLKGIAVADSRSMDTVVISMGPSSTGRRQRSYSVGKAEGVTYIEHYPEEMVIGIIDILKASHVEDNLIAQALCSSVTTKVLGRETWATSIFAKFSSDKKRTISTEFLGILANSPSPISAFLNLPLDAWDVAFLWDSLSENPNELPAISILADFIRSNSKNLASSSTLLVATLFQTLNKFSSPARHDIDETEFVRQAILFALSDLTSQNQSENSDADVSGFVDLLLTLMNSTDTSSNSNLHPLVSQRAKSTSLSVLTNLCSKSPKAVVASLIPALKADIEAMEDFDADDNMVQHSRTTLGSIVPVFGKYASHSGLSLSHLLTACCESIRLVTSQKKRMDIYCSLVQAVSSCSPSGWDEAAMGAVVASYFAGEAFADSVDFQRNLQELTEFALQVMDGSTGLAQVSSIVLMIYYANSLLVLLGSNDSTGETSQESSTSFDIEESNLPRPADLVEMALAGKPGSNRTISSESQANIVKDLVRAILLTCNDAMFLESVRKFVRRSDRTTHKLVLRLWQDLLVLQATASGTASTLDNANDFAETIIRLSGECLEQVQGLMPLPIFFASASSLIKDGETDELRAGAMRLVADRAPEVRPGTPEASLFLDMAALLVGFLKYPETEGDSSFLLQQSALVAIEHIARASYQEKGEAAKNQDRTLLSALQGCADLFVNVCGSGKNMKVEVCDLDDSSRKLLCSTSLCTATLVRATAPKCLALLPKFMHQIIASLCSVNKLVLSTEGNQVEILNDAGMTQVCLLRALAAVTESVPQFIYPYLKHLLADSALPSEALRHNDADPTVKLAAEGLEKSLSALVPVRVLLPVVSTAIPSLKRPTEFEVLLRVLKQSIDGSSGEELVGHLDALIKAVTTTYDCDFEYKVRITLVDAANEALLALVMKLSENHLRRLYSDLREWRGDLHAQDPDRFAMRRYAFWKASAVLGSELRAIFLPCLSTVLADAIDELSLVVSDFCGGRGSEKTVDGKKKRRLDNKSGTSLSPNAMLSIQPLLLCLELSLRADAQDGGNWVRAEDGQRYRSILEPLGALLQSKVPADFPSDEGCSAFQAFVQGGEEAVTGSGSGSVVACVIALASAAGNEQLWKPLNYAVLDACGNRGRSDVRKAGLGCLLALMKNLGEEYMVLLPECLPILAELLEDNDETVAGLAQDCISFGEDLLGESLEDSLR